VAQAAASDLEVTIYASPNLVVDSNVLSPSSKQPEVATVVGRFCNTGGVELSNVTAYIGDYNETTPADSTPGRYPSKTDPGIFSGTYSFTHLGGLDDAKRFIGDIPAGECRYQYWSFTYPKTAVSGGNVVPAWGTSVKPDDDLSLNFEVWASEGSALCSSTSDACFASHTMTMRNEISAMANKIEPNGNPGGRWFNTSADTVNVGETITTNGILYRLGRVNKGFDNNADGVPDYNAWLQPIGNVTYDPSCFRLIEISGTLTVTRSGKPDTIIEFSHDLNQSEDAPLLYFSDLPADNTDVNGEVYYTFLALGSGCTIPISPYQEAASGFDNEKFNADYGSGGPGTIDSYVEQLDFDKSGPAFASESGSAFTYSASFTNAGTSSMGLSLSTGLEAGFVVSDTVPDGLEYTGGAASFTPNISNSGTYVPVIYYSTDSGNTWTTTPPSSGTASSAPDDQIVIQWWLDEPLQVGDGGTVSFQAQAPSGYISGGGEPVVENCAYAQLGTGEPFEEDCHQTLIEGTNSIGDLVWKDDGAGSGIANNALQDGTEAGIDLISVSLYWDQDGDGVLDEEDIALATQETVSGGAYDFTKLPDGDYIVTVDTADDDLPTGYGPTTPKQLPVSVSGGEDYDDADFGFGPSLSINKILLSETPAFGGEEVTFRIDLTNNLPGDGTGDGFCEYTVWANTAHTDADSPPSGSGNKAWVNTTQALSAPDSLYTSTDMQDAGESLGLSGFNLGTQRGSITGVEMQIYFKEGEDFVSNSEFIARVWDDAQGGSIAEYTYDGTYFSGPAGTSYLIQQDLTALQTWDWSHFVNNTTEMQLVADKGSGKDGGEALVDAAAYVITTDQPCGGEDTTIATLPMRDTYDADLLSFVSADPAETSQVTGEADPYPNTGVITWRDLGPLYAGQTKSVIVTFEALNPGGSSIVNTLNYAAVSEAVFGNGRDVNDAADNDDVDITPTGSISGVVYSDQDGDGWQGTTGYESLGTVDLAIPNTTLTLYGCYTDDPVNGGTLITSPTTNKSCSKQSGNNPNWYVVKTTMTGEDGSYLFDYLREGYYYVALDNGTLPGTPTQIAEAGSSNTTENGSGRTCGTCDHAWGDPTQNLTTTGFNPLGTGGGSPGEDITNVNFGYNNVPATVYGVVYYDENGDGSQGTGEDGISGAAIQLCSSADCSGTTYATTTTDAEGNYSFDLTSEGLEDTDVYVVVTAPSSTSQTEDPDETGVCSTCDDATTTALNVSGGESSGSHDFGYQPSGSYSLGDTVFVDCNGDGDQDQGEEGIADITVYLYEDENNDGVITEGVDALMKTTATDGNGSYSFDDLPDGDYRVILDTGDEDFPGNHTQTGDPDEAGICLTCDDKSTSAAISGADDLDNDFGYQPVGYASLGDTVWFDTDGDAVQDPDEIGIGHVAVNLYQDQDGDGVIDAEDALVDRTETIPYQVVDGYLDTDEDGVTAGDGGDDAADVLGYEVIDGLMDINGDGTISDADDGSWFGYPVFNGFVDIDGDSSGASDAGDDADLRGLYDFDQLLAGDYIAEIDQSEFASNGDLTGLSLTNTGTPYTNTASQVSHAASLSAGEDYDQADFGFGESLIGDFVWADHNGDGTPDGNEPGIPGASVDLYAWNDDGDGVYESGEKGPKVGSQTTAYQVIDGYLDVDGDGSRDISSAEDDGSALGLDIIDGELDINGDGSITTADDGQFGGYVVLDGRIDIDGDGDTDAGDDDDLSGYYEFGSLIPGDYIVDVTTPTDSTLTGDPDAYSTNDDLPYPPYHASEVSNYVAFDGEYAVSLRAGQGDRTADFGYQPSAVLGDTVWIDADGDGERDELESGIPNITVNLCADASCTTVTAATQTDGNGLYTFGDMANGEYYVQVETGDVDWPGNLGTTNIAAADPDGTADNATNVTVSDNTTTVVGSCSDSGGVCELEADFGYQLLDQNNEVSGSVFFDGANDGGLYSGSEPDIPYEGITVYLRDSSGVLVATTTTDAAGAYSFTDLADDTYTVALHGSSPRLSALTLTSEPDDTYCLDGGSACNTHFTAPLSGGASDTDNDFGFYAQMDFGDLPDQYYFTRLSEEGAYHTFGSLHLGNTIDPEGDGQPSAAASGDGSDEDGIGLNQGDKWVPGATVDIYITVSGGSTGHVVGWFDWNADGDFGDANEMVDFGESISEGLNTKQITIPDNFDNSKLLNARFRLYENSSISPLGGARGGEVEDYQWEFNDPTAVTLSDLKARAGARDAWFIGVLFLVVLAAGSYIVYNMRTERK
jgi:hypothetical protein